MTTGKALSEKQYAGNPHTWFDDVVTALATPRRGTLLYKMKKRLVAFSAMVACSVFGVDMIVPAGDTSNITDNVTYGTITVNGTLNITGGTLMVTEIRISDGGDQKSGKLVVDGGVLSYGSESHIYIGYNGGTGEYEIKKGGNLASYIVLGHGGGSGNVFKVSGGYHQGRSITNIGADSEVVFNGGYVKLSENWFQPQSGNLTIKATSGNVINIRPFNNGAVYCFYYGTDYTGTVRTEGPGAFKVYNVKNGGRIRLTSLPSGKMVWAHTGGVHLASGITAYVPFRAESDGDFFCQGGTPQDVVLSADVGKAGTALDVNGLTLAVRSIRAETYNAASVVTNGAASTAGSIKVGSDVAGDTIALTDVNLEWDASVGLVKQGACRMNLSRDGFTAPLTVAGGVLNVATNIASASVTQSGGLISVATNCTMTIEDANWTNPAMEEGSTGLVETKGTVALKGDDISIKGSLNVASGSVTCPGFSDSTWHRYFRFTIQYSTARSAAVVALSRLMFMDADGNELSRGLTKVAAGTRASDMPAGTCCYAETGYSESSGSSVANLFDGSTDTVMSLNGCSFVSSADLSLNTWRTILVHLPANELRRVAKYQLTVGTAQSDWCQRQAAAIWQMESSADGVNWITVGTENQHNWSKLPLYPGEDYYQGPFLIKEGEPGPASISIEKLSVASGAAADFTGKDVSISGLEVDMGAYAGGNATITNFVPAANAKLTLVNAVGNAPYALPIDFAGLADGKYTSWAVYVNGVEQPAWIVKARSGTVTAGPIPGFSVIVR